jgi:hypothetical protein
VNISTWINCIEKFLIEGVGSLRNDNELELS